MEQSKEKNRLKPILIIFAATFVFIFSIIFIGHFSSQGLFILSGEDEEKIDAQLLSANSAGIDDGTLGNLLSTTDGNYFNLNYDSEIEMTFGSNAINPDNAQSAQFSIEAGYSPSDENLPDSGAISNEENSQQSTVLFEVYTGGEWSQIENCSANAISREKKIIDCTINPPINQELKIKAAFSNIGKGTVFIDSAKLVITQNIASGQDKDTQSNADQNSPATGSDNNAQNTADQNNSGIGADDSNQGGIVPLPNDNSQNVSDQNSPTNTADDINQELIIPVQDNNIQIIADQIAVDQNIADQNGLANIMVDSNQDIQAERTVVVSQIVAGQPVNLVTLVDANEIKGGRRLVKIPKSAAGVTIKKITLKEIKAINENGSSANPQISADQRLKLVKSIKINSPKNKNPNNRLGTLPNEERETDVNGSTVLTENTSQLVDVSTAVSTDQLNTQHTANNQPPEGPAQQPCQGNETDNCIAILYTLPGPVIEIEPTNTGQVVNISAHDEIIPLTDVLAYTTIPKIFKVGEEGKIKIKWKNNGGTEVSFIAKDLDNDGYIDYLEWVVPHLSDQVFEIIYISKAFQLDSSQNIIEDIYPQVHLQDNVWSTVPGGNYVRFTFQVPLNSTKNIDAYLRPTNSGQPAVIEIYPVYADENGYQTEGPLVTAFPTIDHEGLYHTSLINLQDNTAEVFDFKIMGDIDIDYVQDAAKTWTGATNYDFNTGTNWNPAGAPAAADVVTFDDTGNYASPITGTATANVTVNVTAPTHNYTINTVFQGTTAITKTGASTLTLGGASTNTGTTTITTGTVIAKSAGAIGAAGAALSMGGGTLDLQIDSSINAHNTTLTATSTIITNKATASSAGITHTLGTLAIGAFTLNANAGSNVSGGDPRLTFGKTTMSAAAVFAPGAGVDLNIGALTGAQGITLNGVGSMTLLTTSARTTVAGTTTLTAGTLRLNIANALNTSASAPLYLNGGTLILGVAAGATYGGTATTIGGTATIKSDRITAGAGVTQTLGALSIGTYALTVTGDSNVTSGTAGLTFGASTFTGNPTFTVNKPVAANTNTLLTLGAITDGTSVARTITKNGDGNMTVASAATSLINGTVVDIYAGTLSSNNATALGALATVDVNDGATFIVGASQTIGTLSDTLASAHTANCILNGAFTLTIGSATNNLSSTYSGVINGATGGITKAGSGTLTLTGTNTYGGTTTISAGTIIAKTVGAIGPASAALSMGGGTLDLQIDSSINTHNTTLTATSTIITDKATASSAGITHTLGTLAIGAFTLNVTAGTNVSGGDPRLTFGTTTMSAAAVFAPGAGVDLNIGALTGAKGIELNGAGSMTLGVTSARITVAGTTTLTAGTLRLNIANALNTSASAPLYLNGGTLILGVAAGATYGGTATTIGGTATIKSDRITAGAGVTQTLGALSIGIYALTVTGDSNVTSGTAGITFGASTFTGNPTFTVNNPVAANTNTLLTLGAITDGTSVARTITKNGDGNMTVGSAATSLINGTVVNVYAGTLSSTNATALGALATVDVNGGATFIVGATQTIGTLSDTLASAHTASVIINGAFTLTIGSATNNLSSTYSSVISGATGGITKAGSGTLNLSGTNTYGGTTLISAGTLSADSVQALGISTAPLSLGGGTLDIDTGTTITAYNTTVTATGSTINSDLNAPGTGITYTLGTLTTAGYTLNIAAGSNATSGTAGITFGQTNLSASTATFSPANGASASTVLTLGALVGAFDMNKAGTGTLVLATASSKAGGVTRVNAGTLQLGDATALGTTASTLTMAGGTLDLMTATSVVNAYNTTFTASSTIQSDLATPGTGIYYTLGTLATAGYTITLNPGSNVTSGTAGLTFGATTLSASTVTLDINSGCDLNLGALTGAFNINKTDSGRLILGTASARVGGVTTVTAGTLKLGAAAALGTTGATLTLAGGTLDLNTANSTVNAYNTTVSASSTIISTSPSGTVGVTYTLGTLSIGAYTLTLNAGSNVTSGTAGITFGAPTLTGAPKFDINSPSAGGTTVLTLPATANAGYAITLIDDGNFLQTGALTGTGALNLGVAGGTTFTGMAKLSQTNTFSGGLKINSGTVIGTVAGAFGGASGNGTVTLGDTTGSNPATLLVSTTGLTIANPIVLATNASVGALIIGNTGTAISTSFSGGVTGTNNLTIDENGTSGTITFLTGAINNAGTVTNLGPGSGTTTISAVINSNVTKLTQNSSTSKLVLSGDGSSINGDVNIYSGTLELSGTTTLNVAGNWYNSGTFTDNNSTVNLNGTNQKIFGSNTFYNLTKDISAGSADTLMYQNSNTQTIAGTWTQKGGASSKLTLRSCDASGTESDQNQWKINPQGTRTISYLDVMDSNNINSTIITAINLNSTDSGNNINWIFTYPAPTIRVTAPNGDENISDNYGVPGVNSSGKYSIYFDVNDSYSNNLNADLYYSASAGAKTNLIGQNLNLGNESGDANWSTFNWTQDMDYNQLRDNNCAGTTPDLNMCGNIILAHLNESSGTILDSSGGAHNGSVSGSVTYGATGKYASAMNFDGLGGYVNFGNVTQLNGLTRITVSAWVKSNSVDGFVEEKHFVDKSNCFGNGNFELFAISDNAAFVILDSGSFRISGLSDTIVDDAQWHLITGVYDGTDVIIYVDGKRENYLNWPGDTLNSVADNFEIGGYCNGVGIPADSNYMPAATIDEAAVWNRALSAGEILNMYKRGVVRLKLQVSSCSQSDCSDANFIGPDGTSNTYYQNPSSTPFSLASIPNKKYFQYKAKLETDDTNSLKGTSPVLLDVNAVSSNGTIYTDTLKADFDKGTDVNTVNTSDGNVNLGISSGTTYYPNGAFTSQTLKNGSDVNCGSTDFSSVRSCVYDWNTTGINGIYFIDVNVKDTTNSKSALDSSDKNFKVDNTNPTISLTTPSNGSTVTTKAVTFDVNDSGSGFTGVNVSTIKVKINGSNSTDFNSSTQCTASGTSQYHCDYTESAITSGSNTINIDANDLVLNAADTNTSTFTYSSGANNQPSIAVNDPDGMADSCSTSYNVKWTPNDADAGNSLITSCYADTDNSGYDAIQTCFTNFASTKGSQNSKDCNTSTWNSGNYYIWCTVDDQQGQGNSTAKAYSTGFLSQAIVGINLKGNALNLGTMGITDVNDSGDANAIWIENVGNVDTNITLESTQLFVRDVSSSTDFNYKITNVEVSSTGAGTHYSYGAVPISVTETAISNLHYSTSSNEVRIDISLKVPSDEPNGAKYALLTLIASQS